MKGLTLGFLPALATNLQLLISFYDKDYRGSWYIW